MQFDGKWLAQNTSSEMRLRWKKGMVLAIPKYFE